MATSPGTGAPARAAIALAGIAGFVDAVGYLTLDRLFTAHMSGNTATLGVDIARGDLVGAAPPAVAVGLFLVSIAVGVALMEVAARRRAQAPGVPVLFLQAALLATYLGYGQYVLGRHPVARGGVAFWALEVLAVTAMGLQTAALQRVSGRATRTTYVSGTLTTLAEELVNYLFWCTRPRDPGRSYLLGELRLGGTRRESRRRLLLPAAIWTGYACCAVGGGYLDLRWQLRCLAVPLAALLVVILTYRIRAGGR